MNHFIGKSTFELQFGNGLSAQQFQHEVSQYFWQTMVPNLEHLFDEVCKPAQNISLDKMIIDLGHISEDVVASNQLWELIRRQLKDQIIEARKEVLSNISQDSGQISGCKSISQGSRSSTPLDRWFFYLEQGSYSWDMPLPDEDFITAVIEILATQQSAIDRLRTLLQNNSSALSRIVKSYLKRPDILRQLVEVHTAQKHETLEVLSREWVALTNSKNIRNILSYENWIPQQFWQHIIHLVMVERHRASDQELVCNFISSFFVVSEHRKIFLVELEKNKRKYPHISELGKKLTEGWVKPAPSTHVHYDLEKRMLLDQTTNECFAIDKKRGAIEAGSQVRTIGESEEQYIPQSSAILALHAGVVLAHPFLPRLFKKMGYTEDDRFVDTWAQEKAIYLIHHLATGQLEAEEYELVIPKVLCAWPLSKPLQLQVKIGRDEKEEATNLLQAMINHWDALGSTSPDGLRQGYLMRPGKLDQVDTGWHLTIEKNTIDILLDQLPWTLSLLKLPWMKHRVRVDWR